MVKLVTAKAYGSDTVSTAEAAKRRRRELWDNLNRYLRENGASIVSPIGATPVRVEVTPNSNLPTLLSDAGYQCHLAGRTSRIVAGANPFQQMDVLWIDLPKVF